MFENVVADLTWAKGIWKAKICIHKEHKESALELRWASYEVSQIFPDFIVVLLFIYKHHVIPRVFRKCIFTVNVCSVIWPEWVLQI